jgi:hypothetical protein
MMAYAECAIVYLTGYYNNESAGGFTLLDLQKSRESFRIENAR